MTDATKISYNNLMFKQELNEVLLLIDHISGRQDKDLAALDGVISDPGNPSTKLQLADVLRWVAHLRFPPSPDASERDKDAAFLFLLKNQLNSLAYPARGASIAFTILVTEKEENFNFMRYPQGYQPNAEDSAIQISRPKAAELAFPGLIDTAWSFGRAKWWFSFIGVFVTIISAILLWQVTYGSQLTARFDEAKANDSLFASKVYDQMVKEKETYPNFSSASIICSVAKPPNIKTVSMQEVCDDYSYKHAVFCESIADIEAYGNSPPFAIDRFFLPVHVFDGSSPCSSTEHAPRQEDAQSLATVLTVVSNYLMPMIFGLAGTLTALMRNIQAKVSDSTLLPRDLPLALIRLPLGMIAGISIGLFLSPSTLASQANGTIGIFTISASGAAFLAGYGAEGFFRLLDGLIDKLFTLDQSTPARA